MSTQQKGIFDSILQSQTLKDIGSYIAEATAGTSQAFKNSIPGKIIDTMLIQPVTGTMGMIEPVKAMYNGMKTGYQGIKQIGDGSYWTGMSNLSNGFVGTTQGLLNSGGAAYTMAKSIIPAYLGGALGYQALKKIAGTKTYGKIKKKRNDINEFRQQSDRTMDAFKKASSISTNWQKMRNKTLGGKLQEKRLLDSQRHDDEQKSMFINVQNNEFPRQKDINRISKKDILQGEQQYKQLRHHIKK